MRIERDLQALRAHLQTASTVSGGASSGFASLGNLGEHGQDALSPVQDAASDAYHDTAEIDSSKAGRTAVAALSRADAVAGQAGAVLGDIDTQTSTVNARLRQALVEAGEGDDAGRLREAINSALSNQSSASINAGGAERELTKAELSIINAQSYASSIADDAEGRDVSGYAQRLRGEGSNAETGFSWVSLNGQHGLGWQKNVTNHIADALKEVDDLQQRQAHGPILMVE
jgi:hypothetical protein